jgi:hypothetical protein
MTGARLSRGNAEGFCCPRIGDQAFHHVGDDHSLG